jgi:hypothetical protein
MDFHPETIRNVALHRIQTDGGSKERYGCKKAGIVLLLIVGPEVKVEWYKGRYKLKQRRKSG